MNAVAHLPYVTTIFRQVRENTYNQNVEIIAKQHQM